MAVPVTQSRRQAGKHPAWKSAFPSPRCRAGSSAAQRFQQPGWFLQEKVAFGPRAETFSHLLPLSTPSLKFSKIFSKAFEKKQVPQTSYFSALKGSGLVAKKPQIYKDIYIYVYINAEILCMCAWLGPWYKSPGHQRVFLNLFHKRKHPRGPAGCPGPWCPWLPLAAPKGPCSHIVMLPK